MGGPDKQIPNTEFRTAADAPVYAPTDGVVVAIAPKEQEGPWDEGYGIFLMANGNEDFKIEIDHVREHVLEVGDLVVAGQQIGIAGQWSDDNGQVEIQINDEANEQYLCPYVLASQSSVASWRADISSVMAAREASSDTLGEPGQALRG